MLTFTENPVHPRNLKLAINKIRPPYLRPRVAALDWGSAMTGRLCFGETSIKVAPGSPHRPRRPGFPSTRRSRSLARARIDRPSRHDVDLGGVQLGAGATLAAILPGVLGWTQNVPGYILARIPAGGQNAGQGVPRAQLASTTGAPFAPVNFVPDARSAARDSQHE